MNQGMKLQFGCERCRRRKQLTLAGDVPFVTLIDCSCGSCMVVTHAAGEIVVRRAA